jgi:hypothetical protein
MRGLLLALCVCILPFSASQAQTNLVSDGDFSAPLAPTTWIVGNWGTGFSTFGITGGVFHLTVTAIGAAAWNVFFYHFEDIKLAAGVNYIYSFTSHATAASVISTQVKTVGTATTTPVWFSDSMVSIGTTDSTYSFPFSPAADDDSGQVNYSLGFGNVPLGATIYISNVSIMEDNTKVTRQVGARTAADVRCVKNGVVVNLTRPDRAELRLFNLRGMQVADYSSALRSMTAGSHRIGFEAAPVTSGTYLVSVNNGDRSFRSAISIVK